MTKLVRGLLLAGIVLGGAWGQSSMSGGGGGGYPGVTSDGNNGLNVVGGISTGTGGTTSGITLWRGVTNGVIGWAAQDSATGGGSNILYLMPSTAGGAGQVLSDAGSATCPTLPAGAPSLCHATQWITAGAGPSVSVYRTAAWSAFPGGYTQVTLPWDTVEFDSTGGSMWNVSNPTRLVAPSTGYYLAQCSFQTNSASVVNLGVGMAVNGGGSIGYQGSAGVLYPGFSYSRMVHLTTSQYIECLAFSDNAFTPPSGIQSGVAQLTKLF